MNRYNSKELRRKETDVIKLLSDYARKQGSKNPEMLYMVYTQLVYKILDVESGLRGSFNSAQLSLIATIELMIAQTVVELMKQNIYYKDIYQIVKKKLQQLVGLISVQEVYSSNNIPYMFELAS